MTRLHLSFPLGAWLVSASIALAQGTTYYVSVQGNDAAAGTAPDQAWRTLHRVGVAKFAPGDQILLQRGDAFQGPLRLDRQDGGTAEAPLRVGAYGPQAAPRPTINAGRGHGIEAHDTPGLHISDLVLRGKGMYGSRGSGILLLATTADGVSHIRIDGVDISGFGRHGVSIGAWKTSVGFRDVRITRSTIHDNLRTGVLTWGPWAGPGGGGSGYAHGDIYVGECEVYGMKGGSGITFSSVDGGVVERCVAHHNGSEFSGAAGIWAWDSNNILFQFNESHHNRTLHVDGDGFDFDGGVTNSVMQYNYAHDNDAAGYLVAQYPGAPFPMRNNVIRYNISENDCRKKDYGAIHVWNGEHRDRVDGIQVYNNTVYLRGSPGAVASAFAVVSPVAGVSVHNNLFYTSSGEALVRVSDRRNGVRFLSNAYWSGAHPSRVQWGGRTHRSVGSWLWWNRDQERIGAKIMAVHADPLLVAPGLGGTLGSADLLPTLTGYRLQNGSPLLRRGIDLSKVFGLDPGAHGFFGGGVSRAELPAIGAHLGSDTM